MSEKRVTDLINLGIVNRTEKVFPEEITLLRASTNLMRRLTSITDKMVTLLDKRADLKAIMDLFSRNRDLVHFSSVCLFTGGYPETKILSRVALENFLLIRLFQIEPELAQLWFSDPKKFREKWKAANVRKRVLSQTPKWQESYAKFYWKLCDYTHPSFLGWIELMKSKTEGVYIMWRPNFNPDYASECLGLIFWVIIQSTIGYTNAFNKWLTQDLRSETMRLMHKVQEMVERHFKVREYQKSTMVGFKGVGEDKRGD